jgi:hypothetical protein
MRDLLKYSPYYIGALAVGILFAAIAGVYPSVIVLGVIIVLSFTIVLMVMRVGTHDDEPLHSGPSASVDFWSKLANKVEARQNAAAPADAVAVVAAGGASDEAEKERKRQEALARKAARQSKPAGGDA